MHLSEERGLSKKTVNYHIIAMRSFLRFLLRNDVECLSPEKLELAKIPQREVSFLQEEEVCRLLEAPEYTTKNPLQSARDQVILHMLYGTGLRVSELITLKKDHIIL